MTMRFDDAWSAAKRVAERASAAGTDVVLVRNLRGMVSLVLGGPHESPRPDDVERLEAEMRSLTGPFCAPAPVLLHSELASPAAIDAAPSRSVLRQGLGDSGRLVLVERSVIGSDWSRVDADPPGSRVTLYGFKGGVGRSTATVLLAGHLAAQGQCVLVVDLDLESPGVGSLLLDDDQFPDHGVVDHLVEAAVGNADGLDLTARSVAVRGDRNGEVWVAPAGGRVRDDYYYLPKLNRSYLDIDNRTFALRLNDTISACEASVTSLSRRPDVVLLDSRAGLHDIAAAAITRLSDLSLLFAVDNPHTWAGYRELFREWGADRSRAVDIRERLKMVAAAVPTASEQYLRSYRDRAQTCFAETLYDEIDGPSDGFNPPPQETDAPHSPLPIRFHGSLVGLDAPSNREWLDDVLVHQAFANFLEGAADLIERSVQ